MKFDFIVNPFLLVAFVTMAFSNDSSAVVTNSPLVTSERIQADQPAPNNMDIGIHLKCRNNSFVLFQNGEVKCWPCSKCDSHPKLRVVEQCRKHKDAVCGCDDHRMFYDARNEMCIYYKRCARGLGVSKEGTLNSDVECSECPQGTYSNEVSYSAKCKNHTDCESLGKILLRRGDASADNTCGPPETPYAQGVTIAEPSTILTALTTRNPLHRDTQGTRGFPVTAAPAPVTQADKDGEKQLQIGLGIGLSVLVVAIVLAAVALFIYKKRRPASQNRAHDGNCYQGHGDLPGFGGHATAREERVALTGTTFVIENALLNGSAISLRAPSSCSRQSGSHVYAVVDDMMGP